MTAHRVCLRLSRLLSAVAIAGLVAALMTVWALMVPWAQAQTRITVGGAGPLYYPTIVGDLPLGRFYLIGTDEASGPPLSILAGYDLLNHMVGENWFPGSTAQVVNYPASLGPLSGSLAAPGVDDALGMGRGSLDDQIKNAAAHGDSVVIAGLSEGTLVINRELAALARDPKAPPADLLSFALFASPETGLFDIYLPAGIHLPVVNYTAHTLAESQYDVSVVFQQYDGWADPPDRPWNLLADVNALFGGVYFHDATAVAGSPDVVEVSSMTSKLGGTTTTYMIPAPTVPLLIPLQQLGVPPRIVDALNGVLKPIVDAGYSRLTPDAGPYFSHGRILPRPAPHASSARAATASDRVSKASARPAMAHAGNASRPTDASRRPAASVRQSR